MTFQFNDGGRSDAGFKPSNVLKFRYFVEATIDREVIFAGRYGDGSRNAVTGFTLN